MEADDAIEGTQSFAQLEGRGEKYFEARPGEYEMMWPASAPEDIATIIYTSGTTGEPKGVMLSHKNLIANIEPISKLLQNFYGMDDDIFLSFLPLAHIFERTAGFYVPIRLGCAIAYTESLRTGR
jgi:long-chain acyl-CoA synthetase